MAELALIAAVALDGTIGKDGGIPWSIREDLKRFKRLTLGCPCIIGARTYDRLPVRPLPGRLNVVLDLEGHPREGARTFSDLEAAVSEALGAEAPTAWVCGGASVYAALLPRCTRMELTHVGRAYIGDVRFPPWSRDGWELVSSGEAEAMDECAGLAVKLLFQSLRRRRRPGA
jgi:dihydrofolate reductase